MAQKRAERDPLTNKMLLAAKLYYKDKLSQQEVARRLQISRPWVSRLLSRAEEAGIVRIEIVSPYDGNAALETMLEEKYGLAHVSVVPNSTDGQDALAQSAARFFLSALREEDVVGVGWGTSVSRLIAQTERRTLPRVQVVPLAGSFGNTISHFPNVSALRLSEILGAQARVLHTPARCVSQEEYDTLTANDATRAVLRLAEHADILLVGIGAFADSVSPQYGVFSEDEARALRDQRAIGDVALQYLDEDGQGVDIEATRLLIKADIFKASAIARLSLGIAEGLHKARMIDAALRLKLVNALFTNEETALALLDR